MAEPITIPDLENGKIDIDTLADIVNLQEETTVTRLSGPVKTWYGVMQDLAVSGGLAYETLAELQAITGTQGQIAEVTNDGDNTGRYSWQDGAWVKSLDTTSAKIEEGYQVINENTFPPGFYDFQDAVADDTDEGNVLWAVRTSDGRIVGELATQGQNVGDPLIDSEFAEVEVDDTPDQNIIRGVRWDGTTTSDTGGSGSDVDPYVKTTTGRQHVAAWVESESREVILSTEYNSYNPKINGSKIEYIVEASAGTHKHYKEMPFSSIPAGVTTLRIKLNYGQSHGFGTNAGAPVFTDMSRPDQVLMFNGGMSPAADSTLPMSSADVQNSVAAYNDNTTREVPILSTAYIQAAATTDAFLCFNCGSGGTPIEQLFRGSNQYDNMIQCVSQAIAVASTNGVNVLLDPVNFYHGGANSGDTTEAYKAKVEQMRNEIDEDFKAMLPGISDVQFIMIQNIAGNTGFAQMELAIEQPTKFKCQGPYYAQTFTDSFHLNAPGYVQMGSLSAVAILDADWLPLYPVSALRVGTTVTLTFHNPTGTALVLDDTTITNYADGNYGFRFLDTNSETSITGVSVSGNDVILTLNQEPTGTNPRIGIADVSSGGQGAVNGKRCCLRDSSTQLDTIGNPLYNWACHYRINVTA